MVLPTYLGIKEAAKRIQDKCGEPVTEEWLLQHASEGELQLFALVRDDICVITKPNVGAPIDFEKLGLGSFDQLIEVAVKIVHPVGSRVPLSKEWALRLVADRHFELFIKKIVDEGKEQPIYQLIKSNFTLHADGRVTGWPRPWQICRSDLCFLSKDIERLITVTTDTAAKVSPGKTAEETPAERRAKLDITGERGSRRRILEGWDEIEKRYGPNADGRQVRLFLKQDKNERLPALKTVQNHLSKLRGEKLIP